VPAIRLKLKQASAVLKTEPKELQNLVQFGVVKPRRHGTVFLFDENTLFTAQVALFLKEAFGTKSDVLSEIAEALNDRLADFRRSRPDSLVFTSRLAGDDVFLELKVPFRKITEDIEERLCQLPLFPDLPRGRKRAGWKKEFLASVREAAKDMGPVTDRQIRDAVRSHRKRKSLRWAVTVAARG
jgi:hypothetical protein